MKATTASVFVLLALCCASEGSAVTINMVTVGNPGNAPDTRYSSDGFGSVDHVYQMGKYEVTAGQYTEFLNAVAKADPKALYNTAMGDPGGSRGANIQRTGSSPNYSYSVAADWANRPVNYVSFWDAARFANWLDNGQRTGSQDQTTTEDGAYDLDGFTGLDGSSVTRKPGARFFIPSEDEWYKAAYHKNDGVTGNYWDYPTGTDATPSNHVSNPLPDPGNNANFYENGFAVGSPYYRTEVGEFENSASPYGTFDQGGNVWEWNEAVYGTTGTVDLRVLRGGSNDVVDLRASNRVLNHSTDEYLHFGFRVASVVPEPDCITLCVVGVLMMVLCRRKTGLDLGEKKVRTLRHSGL